MKKRALTFLIAAITVMGVTLSGCGGSSSSYSATDDYSVAQSAYDAEYNMGFDSVSAESVKGTFAVNPAYSDSANSAEENYYEPAEAEPELPEDEASDIENTARKLVVTASVDCETMDYDNFIPEIQDKVTTLGGYCESVDVGELGYGENHLRTARFTIRIPKDKYDRFMKYVDVGGNVTRRLENVEDVTLRYTDVESHRDVLVTEKEFLMDMLEKAYDVNEMIEIENRLYDVINELESAERQLRTLSNMVDYTTVNLYVEEVKEETIVHEMGYFEEMFKGLLDSCKELVDVVTGIISWIVQNIPWIIAWVVIIYVVVKIVKRLVRKHNEKAAARAKDKTYSSQYGKTAKHREYTVKTVAEYTADENKAADEEATEQIETADSTDGEDK